jgi:hypothetical protein
MGMGCMRCGDVERMFIFTDIEALLCCADMGLIGAVQH